MIICKYGDISIETNDSGYYAVFKRIRYQSGTTAFWKQVSKWYFYKAYAIKVYNKYCEGLGD